MNVAPRIAAPNSPTPRQQTKVVGWHFDFVLRIGALADGASLTLELPIPPGAPFCLRAIGGYDVEAGPDVIPLTDCLLQFSDQTDNFLQNERIGTTGDWNTGGENALYEPVYNQITFGPGSAQQVRVTNDSGGAYTNAFLIFRGVKLYDADLIYIQSYPEKYRGVPYQFPVQWPPSIVGDGNILVGGAGEIRDIKIEAKGGDFTFRGGMITQITGSIADVRLRFRDQWGRNYSSDYVHCRWLFSNTLAQRPGVFYPELYIPKDRILLMDLQQNEASAALINLCLTGQRVFPV